MCITATINHKFISISSGEDVRGTLWRESINQCYCVKHSGVDLDTDICLSYLDNTRLVLGHVPALTVLLSWLLRSRNLLAEEAVFFLTALTFKGLGLTFDWCLPQEILDFQVQIIFRIPSGILLITGNRPIYPKRSFCPRPAIYPHLSVHWHQFCDWTRDWCFILSLVVEPRGNSR